ncbi:unnamed protein product [Symbiodinium natans]|uniref:Uncharacterized protein n=1 Tax=Symbiodinium natans TaxID=878477 RepID=A0A812P2E7_9DINO|nr:unnamed protein product [Symbiodinium natans]
MSADDIERQPLLAEEKQVDEAEVQEELDDAMSYDARKLITFDVLRAATGTIWVKGSLWKMMGMLFAISLVTAMVVIALVKQPEKLDTSKYSKLTTFLKAIVGLLLGFFLSSSVNRWYACTCGFLELFTAIRGLHMQLLAMGAPKEHVHMCMRYCVVSACSLQFHLQMQTLPEEDREEFRERKWASLIHDGSLDSAKLSSCTVARLHKEEKEVLDKVEDPSQTLWVWVISLLTRMSADGELPPIPCPTYGKILSWADKAYNGIREVQAAVCVQPPYVYVQMMAVLVAVNNILIAVSFGITLGITLSLAMREHASSKVISKDLQDVGIAFLISTVGPFLYHALLEVAVCIAQPFAGCDDEEENSPGRIPAKKLLNILKKVTTRSYEPGGDHFYDLVVTWPAILMTKSGKEMAGKVDKVLHVFPPTAAFYASRHWFTIVARDVEVRYFHKLYPLAHALLLSGLVTAVCECMVLLSLIFVHHFPSMPVLWQVYCGTVGVGASLALAVCLLSLWRSSTPREVAEKEPSEASLSPARRRSSRLLQPRLLTSCRFVVMPGGAWLFDVCCSSRGRRRDRWNTCGSPCCVEVLHDMRN